MQSNVQTNSSLQILQDGLFSFIQYRIDRNIWIQVWINNHYALRLIMMLSKNFQSLLDLMNVL